MFNIQPNNDFDLHHFRPQNNQHDTIVIPIRGLEFLEVYMCSLYRSTYYFMLYRCFLWPNLTILKRKENIRAIVLAAMYWICLSWLVTYRVIVETKLLMTPSRDNIKPRSQGSAWCKYAGSVHWFSHHVRTIHQRQILSQSFPISFRPGEHCRSPSAHLPVSGFIPLKENDREAKVGMEMRARERESKSKQGMGDSVFGGYGQEGLADMSIAKASRGGLETEELPERDTVVWMIEWGTMPTHSLHSLHSHLSMKTQDLFSM